MDANTRKTQLFLKIYLKVVNRSVVAAGAMDEHSVLAAGGRPSTRSPPGRPRESSEKSYLKVVLNDLRHSLK